MNDLLLTTFLIALIYYAFFYRPPQTKPFPTKPTRTNQFTQTEPTYTEYEPGATPKPTHSEDQTALEQTLNTLIKEIKDLNKELDK